jgi:hypothetical protein
MVKLSLPILKAKKGTTVNLPLNVEGFLNVACVSISIGFDPAQIKFVGFSGQPKTNFVQDDATNVRDWNKTGRVGIAWWGGFDPASVSNIGTGKFLTMKFTLLKDGCPVVFLDRNIPSTVGDNLGNNLPREFSDGSISSK